MSARRVMWFERSGLPPQSAEILSADDVRVAKNLCGGPKQCVVDRKPEPANEFPLRPAG